MAAAIELYLVRHAIAAERGAAYPDDRLRPLTARGATRFREAAKGLVAFEVTFDGVLTSPLVRARETADILVAAYPKPPRLDVLEALAPGGPFVAIVEAIARHAKRRERRLALVGHEPHLGELAARLLGATGRLEFKKGAVALIEVDGATPGGPGTLRWLLPPGVLRAMA